MACYLSISKPDAVEFNFVLGNGETEAHRRLTDDERLHGEILDTGKYADALPKLE